MTLLEYAREVARLNMYTQDKDKLKTKLVELTRTFTNEPTTSKEDIIDAYKIISSIQQLAK